MSTLFEICSNNLEQEFMLTTFTFMIKPHSTKTLHNGHDKNTNKK